MEGVGGGEIKINSFFLNLMAVSPKEDTDIGKIATYVIIFKVSKTKTDT